MNFQTGGDIIYLQRRRRRSSGGSIGSLFAAFDPATLSNAILSNGNLTATNTGTTSTNQGAHVPFSSAKSNGKYYFEIAWTNFGTAGSFGAGIGTASTTYPGFGLNGAGGVISGPQTLYVNGVLTLGSYLAASDGNAIAFAIDLNNLMYWAKNATKGGQWNASGPANPATNTGGIAFPAGSYVPFATFGGSTGASGEIQAANFGASTFVGLVPLGFTSGWPT